MSRPIASLSLDLDNQWSYMKTHGDTGWEEFPSYLDVVVPRVLTILKQRGLRITFFVVGQDAAIPENQTSLRAIAEAGHEIGNHSFRHEPWLHLYSDEELDDELRRAEEAILAATGRHPIGFRGPGFSFSASLLRTLEKRGYEYDASTFPTFLGPIARAYYFMTAKLDREARSRRKRLFGKFSEGFRPLRPYVWSRYGLNLLELPVTTMPLLKLPIHLSYVLYLGQFSRVLAQAYIRSSLALCRSFQVEPSILLHPLDFLGAEDNLNLDFFPCMKMPLHHKLAIVTKTLDNLASRFEVVTNAKHAQYHQIARLTAAGNS